MEGVLGHTGMVTMYEAARYLCQKRDGSGATGWIRNDRGARVWERHGVDKEKIERKRESWT